ncbi:MAG: rhomboid family intramembrane serine protease [Bacteroidales bacterium]|jgi:membrane associated rhomboid family serine protease|nr:rhomboid family intramembrane serine protease [Bacteroidales bacterium]
MIPTEKNKERNALLIAFFYPFVFVIIIWLIKAIELIFHFPLTSAGILPRSFIHLPAILSMPLLHSDFAHLLSNTGPILVLGGFIFYFYKEIAWKVILWIYILSGLWLWIGGREAIHIGASGLVYGFAAFLFFSGIFKRSTTLMTVSLVITFLYGSMVWGFFPEFFPEQNISWEGHLFGFIAGILMAVNYRNQGPKPKIYNWDEDDEEEDEEEEDEDEEDKEYWNTDSTADKNMLDENARPTYFRRR